MDEVQAPLQSPRQLDPVGLPLPPMSLIPRPRVLARLNDAGEAGVVLLRAPAGFGKTALLTQWLAVLPERTAWVSLDGVNDDAAVWSSILRALRSCPALRQANVLRQLGPIQHGDQHSLLQLIDLLADLPEPVRLVFDGLEGVDNPSFAEQLSALLRYEHLPVRLVLATRNTVPAGLDRLRLSGQLMELRASELAFSAGEVAEVAASMGASLQPEQLELLFQQTGGWAAGVVLALRTLRASKDPDALLANLAGNVGELSLYLRDEVLGTLPQKSREVLAGASICKQVSTEQIVAIAHRKNAGSILAELSDGHDLVESMGDGRRLFRARPLLGACLRSDLARRHPAELRRLHRAAAHWHDHAGEPAPALRHAASADDTVQLSALLRRHGAALLTSGGILGVRHALALLGDEEVRQDSHLALIAALAHLESRQPSSAARYLSLANSNWPEIPSGDLCELQALVTGRLSWYVGGWNGSDTESAQRQRSLSLSDVAGFRVESRMLNANSAMAHGDFSGAEQEAQEALAEALANGNPHLGGRVLLRLAAAAAMQGRIRQAMAFAKQAAAMAPAQAWSNGPEKVFDKLLQSFAAVLRASPEEGLRLAAATAAELGQLGFPSNEGSAGLLPTLEMIKASARLDLGERHTALEAMRQARIRMPEHYIFERPVSAWTAVIEHAAALSLGHVDRAREILAWAEAKLPGSGELCLLRAQGPAGIGRFEAAQERLRPLHTGAVKPVLAWTGIHVLVLECSMAIRTGRRAKAFELLRTALAAADELDVLRPLTIAPREVTDLVAERAGAHGPQEPLALRLLELRKARGTHAVSPLTGREQEILALLPSHLSLERIAQELQLSVNTVKTHVRVIYAKLGASSRHEAVAAAYRLGLVSELQP